MFFVYVIRNDRGKIYIGQTLDIIKRLKRHNGELPSKQNSYTKINKGRWEIVYKEEMPTRELAIKRENELKSFRGREYVKATIGSVAQR